MHYLRLALEVLLESGQGTRQVQASLDLAALEQNVSVLLKTLLNG